MPTMILPAHPALCALAALALLVVAPVEQEPPAARSADDGPNITCNAGVTIERTLTMKGARELVSVVNRVDGEEHQVDDFKISIRMGQKQVALDEIRACAGGRATVIARTYATLEKGRTDSRILGGEERKTEKPEESALEGRTVLFTWKPDEERYAPTIDGAAAPELTQDLEGEMDYRALLPPKESAPGAKWAVDFAKVKGALMRPGGDIPFQAVTEAEAMDRRLRAQAWDATDGKLSLELGAVREEDERRLVTIRFEGNLGYDVAAEPQAGEKGPRRLRLENALELEGELVWDLGAGRATRIDCKSKGSMKITMDATTRLPDGRAADFRQTMSFDETYEYAGRFTTK